jgi:hypothetical protein
MSLSILLLGGTVYAAGAVWTYGYTIGLERGGKEEIFQDEKILFIFFKSVLWPVLILSRFLSMPWKALFDFAYKQGRKTATQRKAEFEMKEHLRLVAEQDQKRILIEMHTEELQEQNKWKLLDVRQSVGLGSEESIRQAEDKRYREYERYREEFRQSD